MKTGFRTARMKRTTCFPTCNFALSRATTFEATCKQASFLSIIDLYRSCTTKDILFTLLNGTSLSKCVSLNVLAVDRSNRQRIDDPASLIRQTKSNKVAARQTHNQLGIEFFLAESYVCSGTQTSSLQYRISVTTRSRLRNQSCHRDWTCKHAIFV